MGELTRPTKKINKTRPLGDGVCYFRVRETDTRKEGEGRGGTTRSGYSGGSRGGAGSRPVLRGSTRKFCHTKD